MSGSILPTITHVGAQSLYGAGGGSVSVSSFQTASVSSLTASTITAGTVVAANSLSAVTQSALYFTSSLSGISTSNSSTLLFTVTGGGTYTVNLNLQTTGTTSAPLADVFVTAPAQNTTMFVNDIANTNISVYDISPAAAGTEAQVWFANNGSISAPYVGSFTRIGF